jgi:hypothetical protein
LAGLLAESETTAIRPDHKIRHLLVWSSPPSLPRLVFWLCSFDGFPDAREGFHFLDDEVANLAIELLKKFLANALKRMSRAVGVSGFESKFTAVFLIDVFHQRFLHAQGYMVINIRQELV